MAIQAQLLRLGGAHNKIDRYISVASREYCIVTDLHSVLDTNHSDVRV
eukprot:CAMPEP_0184312048 /NCGR_PEP_ID=MMETSP1049-20130417/46487_1 /TAXON_ID=77928 /ORGANISM="Proteomonas sulcata, Strain CCMP704" /LENGTH=47 /DNA_ID= /DNA_START= /DNA_END= /DNA_ORIENTATION=